MVPIGPKSSWQTQAYAIIEQGYPAIAPLLPDLVAWLRDINWPGASEIAAFLVTIGAPVLPHVQVVLQSTDRHGNILYSIILSISGHLPLWHRLSQNYTR